MARKPQQNPADIAKSASKLGELTGRLKNHTACVAGLGLRKIHQTVTVIDTPENRGMINRVSYLLSVEEV